MKEENINIEIINIYINIYNITYNYILHIYINFFLLFNNLYKKKEVNIN
jgi:hypothetical protein